MFRVQHHDTMTNPEIASNQPNHREDICKVPNLVNATSFKHSSSVMCKQLLSIQGIA